MRKLAIFSCAFAVAAAAYVWLLPPKIALLCVAVLGIVTALLFLKRSPMIIRARIACIAISIGLLWSWGYEQLKIAPMRVLCGEDVTVTATLSGYPEETNYGCRVETSIAGGTMLLYLDDDYMWLKPGDQITLRAEVADVSWGSGESQNLYFQAKDISLLAFQNDAPSITAADEIPTKYLPTHWAHLITQRITRLFPSDTEGFMRALMMGDKSGISYSVQNQMSITGLAHVFSVSGMHVSLLVGFFTMLLSRKRFAAVCGIVAMFVFAAMLGFSPSVTRAVIMNTILLLAPILKRENDPATTLSFALLVILLGNPWAIASLSLQLSFLAMAGIFLFAAAINEKIAKYNPCKEGTFFCSFFRAGALSVATSLSATILTMPLMAVTFGSVSVIAPLSNLLLLNLVSLLFTAGFAILFAGVITPLAVALGWLAAWPIRLVLLAVHWLSQIPFAAVYTDSEYVVMWLIFVYLMLAVFLIFSNERKLRHLLLALAAALFCAIGFSMLDEPQSSFTMLDVGQGQSILAQHGNFTAMVDCGGDSGDADGEYAARRLLMRGHRQLDVLILTHYDDDHTCGFEQLLDRVEIEYLFVPDISDDSGRKEEILLAAQEEQVSVCFVTQDMTIETDGAKIEIMMPVSDSSDNEGLCALMSLGECDILITGDMGIESEYRLLQTHQLPQLQVLVAGHHGSKYSTSEILLERTKPQTVLISVGKNAYGHPSQQVLQRAAAIGAEVYRTDLCGDITIMR